METEITTFRQLAAKLFHAIDEMERAYRHLWTFKLGQNRFMIEKQNFH